LEDQSRLRADVPSATAISPGRVARGHLDRFPHHAEILSITGRSYRLTDQTAPGDRAAGTELVGKDLVQQKTACQ
jgi:hypothetical protein